MGTHSKPIDGTVTANGRALVPLPLSPLQPRGPVSVLPRPQDDAASSLGSGARPAGTRKGSDASQRFRRPDTGAAGRAVSARVIESCYVTMAAVTVVATAVGFWLSYAGLHSFAVQAGLSGPEAWAWPASVDLFILAGELGITISTLRDGRPDWRAWGYFAAGCGPSVTFNVLHVAGHFPAWGKYAVAATPPVAAVLALAALMQQVISLPAALRHMHARQGDTADDDRARSGQPGKNGGEGTGLAGSSSVSVAAVTAPAVTRARGKAPRPQLTRKRAQELAAAQGVSVSTIYRRNRKAKTP